MLSPDDRNLQPVWCIPIHLVLSIFLAICLYYFIESPARRYLSPRGAAAVKTISILNNEAVKDNDIFHEEEPGEEL